MASPSEKLAQMGITLPKAAKPIASYIPARRHGGEVFISGQVPFLDGELMAVGVVPSEVSFETAVACARQCGINILAAAHALVGIENIAGVIRLGGFVACGPDYGDQPKIINGASELMLDVFGDAGRHARAAVGVTSLPLRAPVEIEAVLAVRD